ncbi:Uncharacterised protein [Vibrio cholerae]|nr:Uncharacterised protein [Vibrio cholerae]
MARSDTSDNPSLIPRIFKVLDITICDTRFSRLFKLGRLGMGYWPT